MRPVSTFFDIQLSNSRFYPIYAKERKWCGDRAIRKTRIVFFDQLCIISAGEIKEKGQRVKKMKERTDGGRMNQKEENRKISGQPKRNYQKELEKLLKQFEKDGRVPSLLLHSCCAPCSSYVLEYLSQYFHITVFYYNPNIYPDTEYDKRVQEQKELIEKLPAKYPISFLAGEYDKQLFYDAVKGMEREKEGGRRCFRCYELRLLEAAREAKKGNFDYFTTTLSISPMKNAAKLNEIGERIGEEIGVPYLLSDFKKKNGYRRSVELSGLYGLYRQDYCGCIFSKQEREAQKKEMLKSENK